VSGSNPQPHQPIAPTHPWIGTTYEPPCTHSLLGLHEAEVERQHELAAERAPVSPQRHHAGPSGCRQGPTDLPALLAVAARQQPQTLSTERRRQNTDDRQHGDRQRRRRSDSNPDQVSTTTQLRHGPHSLPTLPPAQIGRTP
jgi:hypothetical protein